MNVVAQVRRTFQPVLALFVSIFISGSLAATPTLEDYGSLPSIERVIMSPSGERFASQMTVDGQRLVVVFGRDLEPITRLSIGDAKIRSIEFATDDLVLIQRSTTEDLGFGFAQEKFEFYQAITWPLDGGKLEVVFGNRRDLVRAVFGYHGLRIVDGRPKAYFGALELVRTGERLVYEFGHGRPALYEVDLIDNRARRIDTSAAENYRRDWLIGPDGNVLARIEIGADSGKWELRSGAGKVLASGSSDTGRAGLIVAGQDSKSVIYFAEGSTSEATEWYRLPLDGSSGPELFLADKSIERIFTDPLTGELEGYLEDTASLTPVFFEPDSQKRAKMVVDTFPGLNSRIVDWTRGFGRAVVYTHGNSDSGSYFFVDVEGRQASPLAYARRNIYPDHVGPISTVAYTASDGLEMDGILTLPPGREAKGLPLIMFPHGGPHSHDEAGFDWWAQAFASRGYAVFQPNFRGSTNRDQAFIRAGYGQWGRKMQTDLSDGLAKLVADGTVDPARVCIVGASYGGYAALAGVTLQNGLY